MKVIWLRKLYPIQSSRRLSREEIVTNVENLKSAVEELKGYLEEAWRKEKRPEIKQYFLWGLNGLFQIKSYADAISRIVGQTSGELVTTTTSQSWN
jgi:hypothetical protein